MRVLIVEDEPADVELTVLALRQGGLDATGMLPVVIFTTSQASSDITRSYKLGANCYLRKPGNLPEFVALVQSMAEFWLGFASLPQREKR